MSKVLFWVIKFMVLLIMFTGMIILTHYACRVFGHYGSGNAIGKNILLWHITDCIQPMH